MAGHSTPGAFLATVLRFGPEQAAAVGGKVRRSGGLQEFLNAVVRARRNAFSEASTSAGSVERSRRAESVASPGRTRRTRRIARSRRHELRARRAPPPAARLPDNPSAVRRRMSRRSRSWLHPEEIAEISAQHEPCAMHALPHGAGSMSSAVPRARWTTLRDRAGRMPRDRNRAAGDDVARLAASNWRSSSSSACAATCSSAGVAMCFRHRRIAAGSSSGSAGRRAPARRCISAAFVAMR